MKEKLIDRLPWLVALLLAVQPLLDVASFWMEKLEGPSSVMLVLRMGLLAAIVLTGFCLAERKRPYWIAAGICAVLLAGHVAACVAYGYGNPVTDLANWVRILQAPVTVLCLITFFQRNPKAYDGMQLGLTLALGEILLVQLLSKVTGTDPRAYPNGHGLMGWFNNTNSQSCILTMLVAASLGWQLSWKKRRPWLFWLTALLGFGSLYYMCTRLGYLGIVAASAGLSITLFLVRRKQWRTAVALAAVCVAAVALLPVSPLGHHLDNGSRYEATRQDDLESLLGEEQERQETEVLAQRMRERGDLTQEEYEVLLSRLEPVYRAYAKDFVAHFGVEKTAELFHYTTDILDLADQREKKLMFGDALMAESPFSARLFGLELDRFLVGENNYDVENDFHGIYYLCGWVGLGAYLLFFLYFLALIVAALCRNAKQYYTPQAAGLGIALLLCWVHAYATASVLRRPNASIYLSAVLAGVYYLVKQKEYGQPERGIPAGESGGSYAD